MYSYDRQVTATEHEAKLSPQQRGWEKRREQDERARYNIPPEYQRAWDKLKSRFRGTPDQRAERFMEYMEEHPSERDEILQEGADRDVARMVREQKREYKEYQRQERERKRQEREEKKRKKMEEECDRRQTRYEDAWYKEQERATKEKRKLKQLREKAEDLCNNCPTCEEYKPDKDEDDGWVPFAASLHTGSVMYNYDRRIAAAAPMSAEDFKKEVEKNLHVGDRQVFVSVDTRFGSTSVTITLINLPKSKGSQGAEAMNNRAVFVVDFDQDPAAKVKMKPLVNLFGAEKIRAKSGHPANVAEYLAKAINQLVKNNEPKIR